MWRGRGGAVSAPSDVARRVEALRYEIRRHERLYYVEAAPEISEPPESRSVATACKVSPGPFSAIGSGLTTSEAGIWLTVTGTLPMTPPATTSTTAAPLARAVTRPSLLTEATASSDEVHSTTVSMPDPN